jgi:hypothetical protein
VRVGNDARGEMLPNEAIGPSKRQGSTWGDLCQVKILLTDESTVEFKHKIIFETYNPKN